MTSESDTETFKSVYLLLDDNPTRNAQFRDQVSGGDVKIEIIFEAIELAAIKDDLEVLEGVMIDFHLNTSKRPDYTYLRYPCTASDCPNIAGAEPDRAARLREEHAWHASADIPSVDVTTGLGAMLYVKQHAPDVPLYGFCELNADHSLLFLCAAQMWLGASAINAEYSSDQIRRALLSSEPEDHLPIHDDLSVAAVGFKKLTDSLRFLTQPAEAFDWLDAYRLCGERSTLAEFKHLLKKRYGRKTLESDVYIEIMCVWQAAIYRILDAFHRENSGWPDLRNVTSAKHWDDNNPVLTFLKSADYRTFFTAPDMRAALAYHRANEQRIKAEDPLDGR